MMFYTIHNTSSGNLLDISRDLPSALSQEYTVKVWDKDTPDLYYYTWDPQLLEFKLKGDVDRNITVHQFLNKFTAVERIAIKDAAKTNSALSDYMDMLYSASFVDLNSQEVYGGLYYLTLLGLIGAGRLNEILA